MTVARINLSHSNENENLNVIRNIRYAAENVSNRIGYYLPLGIALDLRGAEIRITKIGKQFNPKLSEGDVNIKFSCDEKYKDMEPLDLAYVPCNAISRFLKKGHRIFINHGKIKLKVVDLMGDTFFCNVLKGGDLQPGQEIFFPDISKFLNLNPINDDDMRDLKFAVEHDVDFIITSHIENASTIKKIKSLLNEGGGNVKVLSKIQNPYAVDNIEEILHESDGIIFAPSVEIEKRVIPFMYRMVLCMCKVNMRVMFLALDTFLEYGDEECEVVNWLMSSGDGCMITRDAAEGREQLATLTRLEEINSFIASSCESFCNQVDEFCLHYHNQLVVLASSAVTSSLTTHATAIFILSENDLLAYSVYFHLPKCVVIPIVGCDKIARFLNILNGFLPLSYAAFLKKNVSDDQKVDYGVKFAILRGILKRGDTIVILSEKYSRIEYIPYGDNN